jgi:hypothetical protein
VQESRSQLLELNRSSVIDITDLPRNPCGEMKIRSKSRPRPTSLDFRTWFT